MSMGPGDELRIPVRLDVSAIADDLAVVDREVQRIQQRMVAAFNSGGLVRRDRAQRATSIEDVGAQRAAWTPEVRALERQLDARLQAIEREARRGGTRPPLTPQQQARSEAQARLTQAERQMRPTEIDARSAFFDKFTQSLRRGLPNVAGMAAAQGGIPGAAGAARTIMGLVGDNPLVASALAVGAGALAVDATRAGFQRQQAALGSALVGGPAFGDTRTLLGLGVMHAAQQMGTSQAEGAGIAQQLASAGMTPDQVTGNLKNVLTLTKGSGLQTADVVPIVHALGTAGGLTSSQIADVVRDLVDSAGKATGSLAQLTLGLKAWSAVSAAAGRDASSLAAIQKVLGPTSGIDAGKLLAPALGATGAQLIGNVAYLGVSPERYAQLQRTKGGAAQLFALEAGTLRNFGTDLTGQQLGPGALQERGLIDLSGLKSDQVERLGALMQRNPNLAWTYYQDISAKPKPPIHPHIPEQTSKWDQFWIGFGNMFTQATNDPQHEGGPALAARSRALAMTGLCRPPQRPCQAAEGVRPTPPTR